MHRQFYHASDNAPPFQITSELALGITATSNSAFVCHTGSDCLAYAAGCVIVVVNNKTATQSRIINVSKKEIVALGFSTDGRHLASGESGHKPAVRIWEISTGHQVGCLDGHDHAVPFIAFSPDGKYLVSVGNQFDNTINVWLWRKREKLCSTKNTAHVHSITFPEDSRHFLTVGKGHAKFWYIEEERAGRVFLKGVVPLGSIAKRDFSNAVHSDANHVIGACQKSLCRFSIEGSSKAGSTTTSTDDVSKLLSPKCNSRISNSILGTGVNKDKQPKRDKWLLRSADKEVTNAKRIFSIAVDASKCRLFVGCDDGIVAIFDAKTLELVTCLPKPLRRHGTTDDGAALYPDAVALACMADDCLAVAYSDHSIVVWQNVVGDGSKVSKKTCWNFHSSRILGIDAYPKVEKPILPSNSFATTSDDGTIRIWTMSNGNENKLINELFCGDPASSSVAVCLAFNPNGQELAAGFRNGNIRVYQTADVTKYQAVQKESPGSANVLEYSRLSLPVQLLAAGGCDGFISIFNVADGYSLHQRIKSLQSSAINGFRFCMQGNSGENLWLISSSQDKSLRLYGAKVSQTVGKFDEGRQIVLPCSPHDLEISLMATAIAVACHDRNIRLYDVQPGNNDPLASFSGAGTNDGALKRFSVDSSGSLVATICSDKTITVASRPFDLRKDRSQNDRILATVSGHSEQMTGIRFLTSASSPDADSSNGKYFVTVSGDSCILVWKTPSVSAVESHNAKHSATYRQSSIEVPLQKSNSPTRYQAKSRTPSSSSTSSRRSKTSSVSSPSVPLSLPSSPTGAQLVSTRPSFAKKEVSPTSVHAQSNLLAGVKNIVKETNGSGHNNNPANSFFNAAPGEHVTATCRPSSETFDDSHLHQVQPGVDLMANQLQELSLRLVQELHTSPRKDESELVMRRRALQTIFQVRRELDECLEEEIFTGLTPTTK